ncbi:MAG TPA: hypothetical protein ENK57_19920 [Polyangiaceae bacterium]|nr:hypothetical protein [Polyangiaceae bacterium]
MPFHREGVQTNRDAFCIAEEREALIERLAAFAEGEDRDWPGRAGVSSRHYDPRRARSALSAAFERDEPGVERIAYRPHDPRWVCVERAVCHRSRPALRAAMLRSEGAVLTVRKDRGEREWAHFGFSRHVVDNCFLSSRSSCRTRAFPTHGADGALNLDPAAAREWLGFDFDAALLWRFVLCVLASPRYRTRYDASLRADYPRIPPAPSPEALRACAAAGERLASAFARPSPGDGSAPVIVGHRTLHCAALTDAVRGCQEAITTCEVLPPATEAGPPYPQGD